MDRNIGMSGWAWAVDFVAKFDRVFAGSLFAGLLVAAVVLPFVPAIQTEIDSSFEEVFISSTVYLMYSFFFLADFCFASRLANATKLGSKLALSLHDAKMWQSLNVSQVVLMLASGFYHENVLEKSKDIIAYIGVCSRLIFLVVVQLFIRDLTVAIRRNGNEG